ncbi:MAG: Dabb family protein [Planctomycetia bacterium]
MRLTNGESRLKGASGTSAYIIAACAGGAIAAVGVPRGADNIVGAPTVESTQQDSVGFGQWIIAADRASPCCANPLMRYDRAPEFTLMIMHMVLLKIRKEVPAADVRKALDALAALQKLVPGLLSFHGGPYSSPENFEKGYTHGFSMVFKDAASRDIYLPHPEHEKCKAMIFPLLQGGLDGAVAFDYEF